jgi:hypothetical protein
MQERDGAKRAEPAETTRTPKRQRPTLWQRVIYRWTAITAVMATLLVLYSQHPYYKGNQFAPWRAYYPTAFVLWLAFGIFYVRATLKRFAETRYVMRDGGLHLFVLGNALRRRQFWRVVKTPRLRTTCLGIVVKGFFTPLMTGFFAGHASNILDAWLRHKHASPLRFVVPQGNAFVQISSWLRYVQGRLSDLIPAATDFAGLLHPEAWTRADIEWGRGLAYDFVFFVDCGTALIGYSLESRWLGNKTRSVEPTVLGWACALACYPPYNNVLGTYLPLEHGPAIITGENALLALRIVTVLLLS